MARPSRRAARRTRRAACRHHERLSWRTQIQRRGACASSGRSTQGRVRPTAVGAPARPAPGCAAARPERLDLRADRAVPRGDPRDRAALRPRHLREPARDHHRRANDGRVCLRRHAGELPPLELWQGVHLEREELQARTDGPGLRDRHQLRPLHQLPDGGEHDRHAGARDRARRLRPQQLLQRQLPLQALDRCVVDHRLPRLLEELHRRVRRKARPRAGRRAARQLSRFAELRRRPLPPAEQALVRRRTRAPQGSAGACAIAGQRHLAHLAEESRESRQHGRDQTFPGGVAGKHPLLHREECAAARTLAARDRAHRAQDRTVLLPAAPDPGDERRLGHVLAPPSSQHHVRRRLPDRRRDDRVAEIAHQRGLPAAGRPPRVQRHQPVCAGLRDVHRHQAHLREPDRRRPRVVPEHRRQALAADARSRNAQLQGRELHRPVPLAETDARSAAFRDPR